jgi:hypothetical protein
LRHLELQDINNFIGRKDLYEKLIGGPKFEQKSYINKEIKEIRLKQELN